MDPQLLWFVGGTLVLALGVITLGVWMQSKQTLRQRELEHVERMKAIEHGYPLPDADSARDKLLGAIGVVVPVASLAAATWATELVLNREDYYAPRWLLAVVWGVSGLVALAVGRGALGGLRARKMGFQAVKGPPPLPVTAGRS